MLRNAKEAPLRRLIWTILRVWLGEGVSAGRERLTGAHMSSYMLGPCECRVADGTLIGKGEVVGGGDGWSDEKRAVPCDHLPFEQQVPMWIASVFVVRVVVVRSGEMEEAE